MTGSTAAAIHYDPLDVHIDDNPYPTWKRMRDEAPLYRNVDLDFYALSRWNDVEPALIDWQTYRSGRGTIFEIIRMGIDIPPGIILFEDPPIHDVHRKLLSRVFTPKRMAAIEPLVRDYCRAALDPLVGSSEFDVIDDFAAYLPMRTIGLLLGIPEEDQAAIRQHAGESISIGEDGSRAFDPEVFESTNAMFAEYIDWRADHPSDDLMTDLLQAEVEEGGVLRRLTREEVLSFTNLVAGAGNETATRLIGFTVQLLAAHPDQRTDIVADRALIPNAIEEVLRYEPPSPVQARYTACDVELHGQTVAKDSIVLLLNGSANRDERHIPDGERFDVHRTEITHLSFGHGLHHCLGAALARLEGHVALDEFVQRWPTWDIDLDRATKAHTGSVRGWEHLPVVVR